MESGAVNIFHVIVKQITKLDGRKTDMLLSRDPKLRSSLSVYNKTTYNVLHGKGRPSKVDADQEATCATWDAANYDLCSVLFFTTAGSVFSDVRRIQGKTPAGGAGHGRAVLREKFDGCLRAAIRSQHIRMTSMRMRPCQGFDDCLDHIDSFRDRLNACDPLEGPTGRQYKASMIKALPSKYDCICQTHLEKGEFCVADICRMMAAIYAENLSRSE